MSLCETEHAFAEKKREWKKKKRWEKIMARVDGPKRRNSLQECKYIANKFDHKRWEKKSAATYCHLMCLAHVYDSFACICGLWVCIRVYTLHIRKCYTLIEPRLINVLQIHRCECADSLLSPKSFFAISTYECLPYVCTFFVVDECVSTAKQRRNEITKWLIAFPLVNLDCLTITKWCCIHERQFSTSLLLSVSLMYVEFSASIISRAYWMSI